MSDVHELQASDVEYLRPYLPPSCNRAHEANSHEHGDAAAEHHLPVPDSHSMQAVNDLPFVTLTYASSLDGMISLSPGLRTTLSGPETKSMTHFLRLHHDAILVGVGTAIPDDPSLNCRYPGATLDSQPRPVIIDPHRRWAVEQSKAAQLASLGLGKAPWLLHVPRSVSDDTDAMTYERVYIDTGQAEASTTAPPSIPWPTILRTLKQRGIESVMIEGGATVISELLSMPELVDSVIVTIAPTWLGEGGVSIAPAPKMTGAVRANAATMEQTAWRQFGGDAVLCGRLQKAG